MLWRRDTSIQIEDSSSAMLSAGEVLDIRGKESQDSENDDTDSSSHEYRNDELQCYFLMKNAHQRILFISYNVAVM